MLDTLRTPTGRIAFGAVASAALIALTLLVEPGMVAITPALLVPIWIPLIGTERLNSPRGRQVRWALVAFFTGTFVAGLAAFALWELG